jgi:hypothetical protein
MLTIQGRRLMWVVSLTALALTSSIVAHAQATLTGKWQGETNNGATIVLDLTVKDTALTGTLTRNGVSTPLSDGKVSKNTFTFKAKPAEVEEAFSGELADDQIKVWLDRQGPSTAIVLKRVKSA